MLDCWCRDNHSMSKSEILNFRDLRKRLERPIHIYMGCIEKRRPIIVRSEER